MRIPILSRFASYKKQNGERSDLVARNRVNVLESVSLRPRFCGLTIFRATMSLPSPSATSLRMQVKNLVHDLPLTVYFQEGK